MHYHLAKVFYLNIALVCGLMVQLLSAESAESAEDEENRLHRESAYLEADMVPSGVLSPNSSTFLTAHIRNIAAVPIRLELNYLSYLRESVEVCLQLNPSFDIPETAWGPNVLPGNPPLNNTRVALSGVLPNNENPHWPDHNGIVLLPAEGYARRLTLGSGWIGPTVVPPQYRYVVIGVSGLMGLYVPMANGVMPGKPIRFSTEALGTSIPTAKLIPFVHTAPPEPAPLSAPAPTPGALTLDIELPSTTVAGTDLTVTYLLGNPGATSLWIDQNRLVPALTAWTVSIDGKVTATLPAGDATATAATLPMRAAIPLNPGEFLTWQRVLPAAALWPVAGSPTNARHDRQISMCLSVPYWRSAETVATAAPTMLELTATSVLPQPPAAP